MYGGRIGYDVDLHQADFAKMTELGYCCPTNFGSVTGSTLYGGLGYNASIYDEYPSPLRIDLALGLQRRALNMSYTARTYINDPETNQGVDANILYTMDVSRTDLTLDILPQFALSRTLRISLGGRLGYALESELNQREVLPQALVDKGYYFIGEGTSERLPYRNIFAGPVPGLTAFAASAVASASSDIRLDQSGKLLLTPSIWYRHHFGGFTNSVTSRSVNSATGFVMQSPGRWTTQSIGISLAVSWSTKPTRELAPCEELVNGSITQKSCPPGQILRIDPQSGACDCEDTLVVDTTIVTIDAVYAVRNGNRDGTPLGAVNIHRYTRVNYLPLNHVVSFNEGSSNIDFVQRYLDVSPERKKTFTTETMFVRNYQKHVLNIIGSRFANGEISQLALVGFTDDSENRDSLLSLERAMKVREYLYRRWSIPLSSMKIRAANEAERERYRNVLENMGGLQSVLILPDSQASVVEHVVVADKKVSIDPDVVYIDATVQLANSKQPSSLDYQLRLGGNTGGKMTQPVRAVANSGDFNFKSLSEGWTITLSGPNGALVENAQTLPVGSGTKLIPSLRVTTTTGQVIEAQRNNVSSVVPVSVLESPSHGRDVNDSSFITFTIIDYGLNSPLIEQQAYLVRGVLDGLGLRAPTIEVEYSESGTRQTSATPKSDQRRINDILAMIGVNQDQVGTSRINDVSTDSELSNTGNGVLKITFGRRR